MHSLPPSPGQSWRRFVALFVVLIVAVVGVAMPSSVAFATGVTVTFDANGGAGSMNAQTSTAPAALSPNSFSRDNFRFDGWATQANGGGEQYVDQAVYDFSQPITLYAKWVALGFIVTFNANDGSGSMAPQVATAPEPLSQNTFTRDGRTFLGWNTQPDGEGNSYADGASFPFSSSGSQILYAQWSDAPTRTITFLANGGSGGMPAQSSNEPSALNSNLFTRSGYVFSGWNSEADGSGSTFGNNSVYHFAADVSLHAQWTAVQTFSVTFNANGGSGVMNTQTSSVPAPLSANLFTRQNFAFSGWATSANGAVVYEDTEAFDFDANITLFARWTNAVTVTFNPNATDAAGSMATQQVGQNGMLSSNQFTRPGFAFSHWSTTVDGTGAKYADGWAGTIFPSDTTLYAQWTEVAGTTPTVTFNANGGGNGTNAMSPQSASTPTTLTANLFVAPRHRAFMGWNTSPDGSGTGYSNLGTFPFTESAVLYAQWGFQLTLRPNGGSPSTNIIVVIPAPGLIPASPFVRSGYEFVGWYTVAPPVAGTTFYAAGESVALSRTTTLHAQWAPVSAGQKAVGLVANGGFSASDQYDVTQSSAGAANLMANPFARNGHTFLGWSTTKTNQTIAYADRALYPFDTSTQLYAVWGVNTVAFDANDGTGTMAAQAAMTSRALTPNTFTRTGFLFSGWNTAPDGSGQSFAQNAWYPFSSPETSLTLYAQWVPFPGGSLRSVTFSGNAATAGLMPPQQSSSGVSANLNPNTFTRTGYRFAGWRAQGSGTPYADQESVSFSNNLSLFAQWTPLITYKANGGVGADRFQVMTSTTPTLEPNPFTRSGHRFLGWSLVPGGPAVYGDGQQVSVSSIVNQGALTLHAQWAAVPDGASVVRFVTNYFQGNTNSIGVQVSAVPTALSDPPSASPTSFTRNGHHLLGWATTSTGQVEYLRGATYNFAAEITLWAQWEQNTVIFDANGGTGTMAALTSTTARSLTSRAFTREGFAFDGWATSPTGALAYSDGSLYPFNRPNQSRTLFARWVALPGFEVVTFEGNGGLGTMAVQTVASGGELTLAPNTFSRDGFTFTGWAAAIDGSGTRYEDGQVVTVLDDLTLHAQWVADGSITTQQVTFNPNEPNPGTPVITGAMSTQSVTGRTTLSSNGFQRPNAVFTGWNASPGGTGTGYADGSQIFTLTDVTLYAQWLVLGQNEVALEFLANGGSGAPVTPLSGTPSSSVTLPGNTFSLPGFEFVGWNSLSSGGAATRLAPGSTYSLGSQSAVLYAEWSKTWFQVSFRGNGGSGTMSPQSSDRATNLTLNSFTRDRFTFTGWNTQPDGNGTSFANAASFPFAADSDLYAQWEQTAFTVTFNANGGTGSTPAQTASGNSTLTGNGFSRAGHQFVGWSTDPNTTTATYGNGANFSFTIDTTLHAVWQAVYSVTFDANGGTGVMEPQSATTATPLSLADFTRQGFTFTGWNTEPGGGGTPYGDGASYPFASSLTLHAQWTPTTYRVTFNSNGASGSMTSQVSSQPTSLTPSTLSRAGHVFRGWSTASNATSATYLNGDEFPFTTDTILYAVWSPIFTVTYDANNGSGSMAVIRSADPATLRANSFTRTGHAFTGWNTQPDGSGTAYANLSNFPFAQNTTLYAQWAQTVFTVTFDANGGSGTMGAQARGAATNLSPNVFARSGYAFIGWATNPGGSPADYSDGASFPFTTDTTLYALWAPSFTITFDANGGQGATTPQLGHGTVAVQNSSFVRPGQRFVGWSLSPIGQGSLIQAGSTFTLSADVTLYAQWAPTPSAPGSNGNNPGPTSPQTQPPRTAPVAPTPPPRAPRPAPPLSPGLDERTAAPQPVLPAQPTQPNRSGPAPETIQATPAPTLDAGLGPQPADSSPQTLLRSESVRRSFSEVSQERLAGFLPSAPITIEVRGARTAARFVTDEEILLNPQLLLRQVALASRSSLDTFFAVENVSLSNAPSRAAGALPEDNQRISELFESTGLAQPRNVTEEELEMLGAAGWMSVESSVRDYKPGSVVYLVVNSEPLIVGHAIVGDDGTAQVVGDVPIGWFGVGEHRIRAVGVKEFGNIQIDSSGELVIPDNVLGKIREFDLGTQATVLASGPNREGSTHLAIRVVPLDPDAPWWTLWLLAGVFALMLFARVRGVLATRSQALIGGFATLLGAVPGVVQGWTSTVTIVAMWAGVVGLVGALMLYAIPAKKRPDTHKKALND